VIRAVLALLALAAPTHVEPQSSEAPAGARTTFGFLVEHGCGESPTVQVSIQLPDGSFDAVAVAPAGWTGTVEPSSPPVATFTGGPLAADVAETFSVELVTPNRPGETVLFPTVQTCEAGEVAWIDPAEESEEPAPRIVLTENASPILPTGASTSTTVVEAHEDDDGAPAPTSSSVQLEPSAAGASADDDHDGGGGGGGGGGTIWPILLVGLAIGVGVGLYLRSRSHPRSTPPPPD
jgi:uncharacterized protein YcnI